MPDWARLVVAAAVLRVATALILYCAGFNALSPAAQVPPGVYIFLLIAFTLVGITLIVANRNDVRAAWLGTVLILIVSPLTNPWVRPATGVVFRELDAVRADAFVAAALWRFTAEFPTRATGRNATLIYGIANVAVIVAAVFATVNLSLIVWPALPDTLGWRELFVTWRNTNSLYWPVLFLLSAAAVVALIARMLVSRGDDRVRTGIFVGGFAAGIMPLLLEVSVEETIPAYKAWAHTASIEPKIGALLFGAFALIPFVTTYSVIYDNVVNVRIFLRAAIQHALAKYTILLATMVPFFALGLYLNAHRDQPLIEILSGQRAIWLIAAIVVGVASLQLREQLLRALDRRFFREPHDTGTLLTTLVSEELLTRTPDEIAVTLRTEVDRTLHARVDLFVADDDGVLLHDPFGERPPLPTSSTLLRLALADSHPMDLGRDTSAVLPRLPESDREWIDRGGYVLIAGIKKRHGEPAGVLALTAKRSELQYSPSELRSIVALAAPLALAIENDRLSRGPEPRSDAPARECSTCSRLSAPGTERCGSCGGELASASAPHTLRGVYRLEQKIGAGGMGVVYRATDLSLSRDVAIKTLPKVSPPQALQLKREAQAMASLIHPHLAVVYGIEAWRGTPFLVQEYLAGGMLSHRLRRGGMPIAEVLEIGVALSRVLGQLHGNGIIHCDIKPSNIGFSATGIVKVVDFGLAYLLRESGQALASTITRSSDTPQDVNVVITARGLMGTPAYMSPEAALAATPSTAFDIWGLSVVLFEAIAGRRPFAGANVDEVFYKVTHGERPDLRAMRPDCPAPIADLFKRALAIDPVARPATAAALEDELLSLQRLSA